jgi:hypothetical protein
MVTPRAAPMQQKNLAPKLVVALPGGFGVSCGIASE